MATRNPRDIQREVVKDLGEHIRRNRRGLPLLTSGPDGRKETKQQTKLREDFEKMLQQRTLDHVCVFLKPLPDAQALEDKTASECGEKEEIDKEEADIMTSQLMELLDEEKGSDDEGSGEVN